MLILALIIPITIVLSETRVCVTDTGGIGLNLHSVKQATHILKCILRITYTKPK